MWTLPLTRYQRFLQKPSLILPYIVCWMYVWKVLCAVHLDPETKVVWHLWKSSWVYYWKCNFPMTWSVCHSVGRLVGRSIGRLAGLSVCHDFLEWQRVTLPCSYRSTCFRIFKVIFQCLILGNSVIVYVNADLTSEWKCQGVRKGWANKEWLGKK